MMESVCCNVITCAHFVNRPSCGWRWTWRRWRSSTAVSWRRRRRSWRTWESRRRKRYQPNLLVITSWWNHLTPPPPPPPPSISHKRDVFCDMLIGMETWREGGINTSLGEGEGGVLKIFFFFFFFFPWRILQPVQGSKGMSQQKGESVLEVTMLAVSACVYLLVLVPCRCAPWRHSWRRSMKRSVASWRKRPTWSGSCRSMAPEHQPETGVCVCVCVCVACMGVCVGGGCVCVCMCLCLSVYVFVCLYTQFLVYVCKVYVWGFEICVCSWQSLIALKWSYAGWQTV